MTSLEGLTEKSFTEYWRDLFVTWIRFLFNLWGTYVNFKA